MKSAPTRPSPPTLAELSAALDRLPIRSRTAEMAMHLAMPVTAAVGPDVRRGATAWSFRRGVRLISSDPVADAVALAADVAVDDDVFVDLAADRHSWVKPLRSGSRIIVFGAPEILGTPPVTAELDVPADALAAFLADVAATDSSSWPTPPMVSTVVPSLLLDGTANGWTLRSLAGSPPLPSNVSPPPSLLDMAREFSSALGGAAFEVVDLPSRFPGTTEAEVLVFRPDGWELILPVTLSAASEVIGVAPSDVDVDPSAPCPEEFTALGRSRWESATVAAHPSGLTVLARRV